MDFTKKIPDINAKELKAEVKQLEKVGGRRGTKSALHKSHNFKYIEERKQPL